MESFYKIHTINPWDLFTSFKIQILYCVFFPLKQLSAFLEHGRKKNYSEKKVYYNYSQIFPFCSKFYSYKVVSRSQRRMQDMTMMKLETLKLFIREITVKTIGILACYLVEHFHVNCVYFLGRKELWNSCFIKT